MKIPRTLICISDTHCGCRLGLCPDDKMPLDDGGFYTPSPAQKIVWSWWKEFWNEWVPDVTNGEPYWVVHNGDAIEGAPHQAITGISMNPVDQINIAYRALKPVVEACEGRYYHIRGTEAHVGKSGQNEEALATRLGAIPNQSGQYSRYELWKKMGGHLVHFLHHIGTTSSSAHESAAVNAELTAEFNEAARWGEQAPSVIVRSHRHRNISVSIPTKNGYASAVVTPAWQLKTPFTYKIPGARLSPPQFGGIVVKLDKRGKIYTDVFVKHLKRDEPE